MSRDVAMNGLTNVSSGAEKRTLGASIADNIRDDILNGLIEPGKPLRFGDLKKRYGASVSPLRDALLKLVADGLVTLRGQQGFRVALLSIDDIKDVTLLRKMLECLALRRSIKYGDVVWEANSVRAFHVLSRFSDGAAAGRSAKTHGFSEPLEEAHREFHFSLISGCNMPKLSDMCAQLWGQADRYRRLSFRQAPHERDVMQEHREILDTTIAKDADEAARLLEAHIDASANAAIAILSAGDASTK